MPTLNKLTCTILLPPTDTPLPEYRRKYLDSSVSVYVPVPEIPILQAAPAFNIQLRSEDEWIAPGLAMFVYIDGYYQCNRSKRTPLSGSSALELRVRQKEEKLAGGGGGFVGREWRWVQLDVGMFTLYSPRQVYVRLTDCLLSLQNKPTGLLALTMICKSMWVRLRSLC
jgi:hypothetical protein